MRPTLLQLLRCVCAIVFVALMNRASARSSSNVHLSTTTAARFTTPSSPTNDQICEQVKNIFATKQQSQLNPIHQHHKSNATSSIHGSNSTLCSLASTCCNSDLEARFDEMVTSEFLAILQTTTTSLKNLLATNVVRFQENFLGLLRASENVTSGMFAERYKRMSGPAAELIDQLYGSLAEFLKGGDVDPAEVVSTFFDGLFPLVYHHSINPKLTDFDDDYKECLRATQDEVRPFGDEPPRIAVQVARAFQAARTFLQALHLGVEVLNSTEHLELAGDCRRSLTRLLYCPLCQGLVSGARACNGYCANVVRGCLANAAELDQPWNDYVTSLQLLVSGMKGGGVVYDVTSTLPDKISDAILDAVGNGVELSKKVKKACGHPKRAARDAPVIADTDHLNSTQGAAVHSASTALSSNMQAFMHTMQSSDKFYFKLANTVCNDGSLAVPTEENCWNGETLGGYTKTIAGVGLSAQKYNPELKMQHWKDAKISQLADKLKHMKQILHSRTVAFQDSDSLLVNDGSGSGWRRNGGTGSYFDEDDEDYSDGSGSGIDEVQDKATHSTKHPNINPDVTDEIGFTDDGSDTSMSNPPSKDSSASSVLTASVSVLSAVIFFLLMGNRLNG